MASFSAPNSFALLSVSKSNAKQCQQQNSAPMISFPLGSKFRLVGFQGSSRNQIKIHAQLNEVTSEKALKSAPKESSRIPDVETLSAFMNQVHNLVELVDSRDIMELELKQTDYELIIRKKEALRPILSPGVMMQPPPAQPMLPHLPAPVAAPAASTPAVSAPASAPVTSALAKPKSSHPPLKCPMAGTFYRSPAPGAPPFVKVGDKVQKGQVVCIIEAMKLMNEIEADQSGTIVEILVDDAKPVSVDTPLLVIEP
ncbi:Biotin/lipoyl attachment [Dillenia turbinata]|uniref:Biotin carboxyl carrier protein of acetyl-CoA carboxylase n=1 Tax=Dillenia turbinata TaxID=194707 RepID=A0AAN8Z531_9MAGN